MNIIKLIEDDKCYYNNIDNSLLRHGKIGFVGVYINKEEDGSISSFCSFPKNYKKLDDYELEVHVKYVMNSILKSKRCMEDTSNEENLKGSSLLYVINELVEEFYKNGLYYSPNKKNKTSYSGNINFNKTINKKIPRIINNNLIYDEYIVTKKCTEDNLITHCMAYIIKEGTSLFKFYFNEILDTNFKIDNELFTNLEYLIDQLYNLKLHTFKDRDLHILNCIIDYFTKSNASSGTLKICTTNYNLVWQDMIQEMLPDRYVSEHKEKIGLTETGNAMISLDHYCKEDYVIYDSKYYKDELKHSYKELFYVYHMAMLNIKNANITSYDEVIEEKSKWTLKMIAPKAQDHQTNKDYIALLDRTYYDGFKQEAIYLDVYEVIRNYLNDKQYNLIDEVFENIDNHEEN